MDKSENDLLAKYFPHWSKYLNVPSHNKNQDLFCPADFIQSWKNRFGLFQKVENDVCIDVDDLVIDTVQNEIDQ